MPGLAGQFREMESALRVKRFDTRNYTKTGTPAKKLNETVSRRELSKAWEMFSLEYTFIPFARRLFTGIEIEFLITSKWEEGTLAFNSCSLTTSWSWKSPLVNFSSFSFVVNVVNCRPVCLQHERTPRDFFCQLLSIFPVWERSINHMLMYYSRFFPHVFSAFPLSCSFPAELFFRSPKLMLHSYERQ